MWQNIIKVNVQKADAIYCFGENITLKTYLVSFNEVSGGFELRI